MVIVGFELSDEPQLPVYVECVVHTQCTGQLKHTLVPLQIPCFPRKRKSLLPSFSQWHELSEPVDKLKIICIIIVLISSKILPLRNTIIGSVWMLPVCVDQGELDAGIF